MCSLDCTCPDVLLSFAERQGALSQELHVQFVTKVAAHVAKNVETLLMRKRFNQLGAMQVHPTYACVVPAVGVHTLAWLPYLLLASLLQFEKDMRSLVAFFSDRSSSSVKSKLTRLVQLSRMLSMESPSEVCACVRMRVRGLLESTLARMHFARLCGFFMCSCWSIGAPTRVLSRGSSTPRRQSESLVPPCLLCLLLRVHAESDARVRACCAGLRSDFSPDDITSLSL